MRMPIVIGNAIFVFLFSTILVAKDIKLEDIPEVNQEDLLLSSPASCFPVNCYVDYRTLKRSGSYLYGNWSSTHVAACNSMHMAYVPKESIGDWFTHNETVECPDHTTYGMLTRFWSESGGDARSKIKTGLGGTCHSGQGSPGSIVELINTDAANTIAVTYRAIPTRDPTNDQIVQKDVPPNGKWEMGCNIEWWFHITTAVYK